MQKRNKPKKVAPKKPARKRVVKAWAVLKDLNTGEYKDIDYLCGYPRIFIQKTKPVVRHENKELPVVPCTITYKLPPKKK